MIIRMIRNAQVSERRFDTVLRAIRSICRDFRADPSSEHWQVAHPETRVRARNVILSLSAALTFVGCSVYDSSLLEHDSLGAGGTDASGSVGGSNAASEGGGITRGGDAAIVGGGSSGKGGATGSGAAASNSGASAGESGMAEAGGSQASGTGGGGIGGSGGSSAGGGDATAGSSVGGASNPTLSVIDDMENPDQYIPNTDGRQGFWSLSNDGTAGGVQTPPTMVMSMISGGRGASTYALHTTAAGFTKAGAQVDVDINRKGATRNTYDASAYSALQFYAKVASGSPTLVHVAVPDVHTDLGGKLCTATGQSCYDHFAKDLTLTTDWALYTVKFSDLTQQGWGNNGVDALDAAAVYGVYFSWTTAAMDLWIDDLAFVKK